MGLGDAKLPGQTGIVDGVAGRCARAAVVAGDEDDLCAALGDTGSDGADAGLTDQLDVDVGVAVGILEVVDKLCKVFDGVDVVVRRG